MFYCWSFCVSWLWQHFTIKLFYFIYRDPTHFQYISFSFFPPWLFFVTRCPQPQLLHPWTINWCKRPHQSLDWNARLVKLLLAYYHFFTLMLQFECTLSTPERASGRMKKTVSSSVFILLLKRTKIWSLQLPYPLTVNSLIRVTWTTGVTLLLVKDWKALLHVSFCRVQSCLFDRKNNSSTHETVFMCQVAAQKPKPLLFLSLKKKPVCCLTFSTDEYSLPVLNVLSEGEWSFVLVLHSYLKCKKWLLHYRLTRI